MIGKVNISACRKSVSHSYSILLQGGWLQIHSFMDNYGTVTKLDDYYGTFQPRLFYDLCGEVAYINEHFYSWRKQLSFLIALFVS